MSTRSSKTSGARAQRAKRENRPAPRSERRPAARLRQCFLSRLSDARFDAPRITLRAQESRWAASLNPFPFKEEVMGSNPIRATRRVAVGRYAMLVLRSALICCGDRFSANRFSARALRLAANTEGARRRSSTGRSCSTDPPVSVHRGHQPHDTADNFRNWSYATERGDSSVAVRLRFDRFESGTGYMVIVA